ncbi:MAG TPA: POTRA domain-containing protein, partial [Spirochaetia bacterium]|nr:POTRA domain-containing protein [Spirochaetia bacterium]
MSEQSDWFMDKPITDIRFSGLSHVNPRDLDGIVKQFVGKKFNENLFLDLQSKLYALNLFESFTDIKAEPADPSKNAVVLIFEVVEKPIVREILIEGNKNIRKADILEVVLLKKDDIVNRLTLKSDADAVKRLYMEKGYPDATVETIT